MVCKSPFKYKSVDLKFLSARNLTVRNVCPLTLIRLKQTKSENNSLSLSSVFLQWHDRSSIHPSLNIIYSLCPDASENRLRYTHIQLYITLFFKSRMISTIYHKYSESFIENIPFPASYAMRIY